MYSINQHLSIKTQEELKYLNIDTKVVIYNRFDLLNASLEETELIQKTLFNQELVNPDLNYKSCFRIKTLEGGFNQIENELQEIISKTLDLKHITIKHSWVYCFSNITNNDFDKARAYFINPIEVKEIPLDLILNETNYGKASAVSVVEGFIESNKDNIGKFRYSVGVSLDDEDLIHVQKYFQSIKRNPTVTELKLIDTYWSDHCRHTTFLTQIDDIDNKAMKYKNLFDQSLKNYYESRKVAKRNEKPITLMDLATINAKELVSQGILTNIEKSEEVNAASVEIKVNVEGVLEDWLLMFKNETHNHPTEIEPFGGASTCLGGAIRDPLSGRAEVYQAMRITGCANPLESFEETMEGKLPQRKITKEAMAGYSSYGYQIGSTTGLVKEIYHPGYKAKRMECGALVAAVKKENIQRGIPEKGDLVLLLGGLTGRDGIGAAVGSSDVQQEDALSSCGAQVQKGNPPVERKIVRLFQNPKASILIKRCNDFGAGGVGVAVGELADGLHIDLDKVPTKYPGLDGTEVAISESQERMAVVIASEDLEQFLEYCKEEDVMATIVAKVSDDSKIIMTYKGQEVVNIDRSFLNTNGTVKNTTVTLVDPSLDNPFSLESHELNLANQKGLIERFDHTVGSKTVLSPLGGKYQQTFQNGMVSLLPANKTTTCSIMTYGYNPDIASYSPYHGGYYAVIESLAKIVACGGDVRKVHLSFQEFFERLEDNPVKWGKPFLALLGAYQVLKDFDLASIGGKDSMSGSFKDINVPPTLISFAVTTQEHEYILSKEFKGVGNSVLLLKVDTNNDDVLDLKQLKELYININELNKQGKILSASTLSFGGLNHELYEMSLGNKIGIDDVSIKAGIGSIILEVKPENESDFDYLIPIKLGTTKYIDKEIKNTLNEVFKETDLISSFNSTIYNGNVKPLYIEGIVKVCLPVFEGMVSEIELQQQLINLGADVNMLMYPNAKELAKAISQSHFLILGDGHVCELMMRLMLQDEDVKKEIFNLNKKGGLVLGIGAGLRALAKTGYLKDVTIEPTPDGQFLSRIVTSKVLTNKSAWTHLMNESELYNVALASQYSFIKGGLAITQFMDGSCEAVVSEDGLICGVLTNIERQLTQIKNVEIIGTNKFIESALSYFKKMEK